MKIGTENRNKTIAAAILGGIALLLVIRMLFSSPSTPAPSTAATAPAASAPSPGKEKTPIFSNLDPSLRLDLLKGSEDVTYKGSGHDIFLPKPAPTPTPVISPMQQKAVNLPPPPPTPTPLPPINLKFYGFANNKSDNVKKVFLSEGDYIFIAKEGDIVKGRYRIVRVNPNSIEVEDVLNNNRQSIPLTTG